MAKGKERAELATQERRENVAALYLAGRTQIAIGRQLKVDHGTVSRDLAALRAVWLERSLGDFDEAKAQELAKIDALEATAHEAWQRSVGKMRRFKRKSSPEGITKEVYVWSESGNPAFLDTVLKCIAKRCDIFGINAPQKVDSAVGLSVGYLPPAEANAFVQGRLKEIQAKGGAK